jgi:tRNA-splicing ligase RtcB
MIKPYVLGHHEPKVLEQLRNCCIPGAATAAALCADAHFGYSMPIGGVVAYDGHVAPAGVGFDIACGNKAVRTDMRWGDLKPRLATVMDDIVRSIEFGIGRRDGRHLDHPVIESPLWSDVPAWVRGLRDIAALQLGTVGSGNHYVDLFRDEYDRVWIGVHFGSRGLGHKSATGFLNLAAGRKHDAGRPRDLSMDVPDLIRCDTNLGEDYWRTMTLAGEYAYAGRDLVCSEALRILGAWAEEEVHNHHNFAWREHHGGREVIVIRKGATPAFPGQKGFVGATMGEPSVILEGVESPQAVAALRSTVHGAGRVMSRNKAAGRWKKFRKGDRFHRVRDASTAAVDWKTVRKRVRDGGVELRGGGADEAPEVYKRLDEVLAFHAESVRVLHVLTPVGVAMAGEDVHDPYRD